MFLFQWRKSAKISVTTWQSCKDLIHSCRVWLTCCICCLTGCFSNCRWEDSQIQPKDNLSRKVRFENLVNAVPGTLFLCVLLADLCFTWFLMQHLCLPWHRLVLRLSVKISNQFPGKQPVSYTCQRIISPCFSTISSNSGWTFFLNHFLYFFF